MTAWFTPVRIAWGLTLAALLALCLAYMPEIASAVATWNASTAYGHCWLVLPIVVWLLWERRGVVRAGVPRPWAWPALAAAPVLLVWLAADWLGIMEGRQLALVSLAELVLMAGLGWRLWWALSPAFLYLLFLVPFGAFITPALQRFTTAFILGGLRALAIPFESDAFQITIPEGVFYVAEACAGLRFLIASIAFGVLYAVTMFRSPWRRAAFIALACVVPIFANGVRGLGIVVLGHLLGSAEAGAADHLIYGWVFFSFVIILLALSGLPFRQDVPVAQARSAEASPAPRARAVAASCVAVLAVAVAGPLTIGAMAARAEAEVAAVVPQLRLPPSCRAVGATLTGATSTQVFQCQGVKIRGRLHVTSTSLPAGANPARILDAARGPAVSGLVGNVDMQPWRTPAGVAWMMVIAHDAARQGAFTTIVDHRLLLSGLRDRLMMARATKGGAVAISVTLESDERDAMDGLQSFLALQTGLAEIP